DPASGNVADRLYRNLKYGQMTPGFQLDKGVYRFGIQSPSGQKRIILDFSLITESQLVYTVIVTGRPGDPKNGPKALTLEIKGIRDYQPAVVTTLAANPMKGSTQSATSANSGGDAKATASATAAR